MRRFALLAALIPISGPAEQVDVAATSRVRSLDPARTGDAASIRAILNVYEGLLRFSYEDRPYRLEPCLAAAMPCLSEDGRTLTISLKNGVVFQDDPCFRATGGRGRDVTAEDVIFSWKRMADRRTASPGYWAFRGRIRGLDAFREASGRDDFDFDQPVEGLRAPDPHTLVVELTGPQPLFPWVLAMHSAAVVPREAVEQYGERFGKHPVGTGPFRLVSWQPNYRLEFERHPRWGEGRPGETPTSLDRLVRLVVNDSATRWMMFLRGELSRLPLGGDERDAAFGPGRTLSRPLRERGIRLLTRPTLDVEYIGFNMEDPVVGANPALRHALTLALDRDDWARFYDGRVAPLYGPVPAPLEGARTKPGPTAHDPEAAAAALAEAGWPGGVDPATGERLELTLELAGADNPEFRQSNDLFIDMMRRIGVRVRASYNNRPVLFEKLEEKRAQMFRLSWIADYPDALNFLQLFYGPNRSPGSNRANYANPEVDRLFELIRALPESAERSRLIEAMVDRVVEDAPWIVLHQPLETVLVQPWLKNYRLHAFPYGMIRHASIDPLRTEGGAR
jgi:oligopeptide transport system substrate-binding protein